MELQITHNKSTKLYELDGNTILSDGQPLNYSLEPYGQDGCILTIDGQQFQVYDIEKTDGKISFTMKGNRYTSVVKDEQTLLLEKMGFKTGAKKSEGLIKAPMPGKILRLTFEEGDTIEAGQTVVVLEAMKMENELKTSTSGTVMKIYVATGDSVEKNTTLIEIG